MINTALRILLVEDNETDAELISRHIRKIVTSPVIQVVDNLADCNIQLHNFVPDVVIADYNLPTCTGFEVLELTRSMDETISLIFITGAVDDEELAANTILSGASGFILKQNMKELHLKLGPLLKRVVSNMGVRDDIREEVRRNKISVNQIYQYLDKIKADNSEQNEYLDQIRKNIDKIKPNGDDEQVKD